MISRTEKEKYQRISKKFITKKYENATENIKEVRIIGIKSIKDSKINNFTMFDFSKPKILKTRF